MSITVNDQLHRSVTVGDLSRGIVSLVPSQTELLFDLGLGSQVTGLTKFCIHPEYARNSSVVIGGTKNLHFDKIRALKPSLILANKEENNKEDIEALSAEFPVYVSDVHDLDSALDMITAVGSVTGTEAAAELLTEKIRASFSTLQPSEPVRTLYLIWNEPMMAAGNDTFISDMMLRCGLINIAEAARYPVVDDNSFAPDLVLLSSEPYPFTEKHIAGISGRFPGAVIIPADGTFFSWYGSRLANAPDYFKSLRITIDSKLFSQRKTVS